MKKLIFMAALAVSSTAFAAEIDVTRTGFGTGTPANSFGNAGVENAKIVNTETPSVLHAPQYMPNFPTAATIWPRVIEVPCSKSANDTLVCDKYEYSPSMGRAEYLYITPVVKEPITPQVVTVTVPGPERIVLKEVPAKPKSE